MREQHPPELDAEHRRVAKAQFAIVADLGLSHALSAALVGPPRSPDLPTRRPKLPGGIRALRRAYAAGVR